MVFSIELITGYDYSKLGKVKKKIRDSCAFVQENDESGDAEKNRQGEQRNENEPDLSQLEKMLKPAQNVIVYPDG